MVQLILVHLHGAETDGVVAQHSTARRSMAPGFNYLIPSIEYFVTGRPNWSRRLFLLSPCRQNI